MGQPDPAQQVIAGVISYILESHHYEGRRNFGEVNSFFNSGVKLCCEGSPLLDDLRALEAAGVEVIACGTCLNFFELVDRLAVGRVTDMLEIAGRLAGAGSIVRP